jgi:hypothetical protein
MQAAAMRISGAGQKIELDRHRAHLLPRRQTWRPTGAHTAQLGGLIRFVRASTDSAVLVAVPAAEG